MKRSLTVIFLLALLIPLFTQDYDNAGMDYTKALLKKTRPEKITAFKTYLSTYTDTSNKFVKLAYFQLTSALFQNNNYSEAIKYGKKSLSIMDFSTNSNEVTKINLILGNCYGIKSSPEFDKSTALEYTNKAITQAKQINNQDIVNSANQLKSQLTGPPPKTESPEQKFLRLYQEGSYQSAINQFSALSSDKKSDPTIHTVYARALNKAGKYSDALKEYGDMYQENPKASTAYDIAKIHDARKNHDSAVDYYLEASILYGEEKNFNNKKISEKKAKASLQAKYNYDAVYRKARKSIEQNQNSQQQNEDQIRAKERELRKLKYQKKKMEVETGIAAPPYLINKINQTEKELAQLKSGQSVPSGASKEYEAFKNLQEKIEREYKAELAEARKRLEDK